MTTQAPDRLTRLLQDAGLLDDIQLAEVIRRRQETGASITSLVVDGGYATEEIFLTALARSMQVPFMRLADQTVEPDTLVTLPAKVVYQYQVMPLEATPDTLRVATHDPFRPGLMDALRLSSGRRVRFTLCPLGDLEKTIKKFYGVGGETIERMMQDDRIEISPDNDHLEKADLSDLDEDASVMKFVNQIIWEAFQDGATDIHFEPQEKDLRIRYRIDGVLHHTPVPPSLKRFQSAILTRIKVMANMDIAEKRLPQDGRIGLRIRGQDIDIRVSTMPTVYGESISLRLLMNNAQLLSMDKLGLDPPDAKLLTKMIHRPHGIILVTGPTGSGKSTSLYTFLKTINTTEQRLLTAEDPIEYEMPGINQVQVKPDIGLTFAVTLRHFLRQDPDVIMVGEIRDRETAEIAIQAALTGHLVFSTLHTNDAASGFTRLVDMGIEPFLIASSIEALMAQRLVRKLCTACCRPTTPDPAFLESIQFPVHRLSEGTIMEPVGCETCRGSGYRGRTGIYEVLDVNDRIRPLVVARESAGRIKQEALRQGMKTLREDGWNKVLRGVTTIGEVVRVTEEDEEQI